MNNSYRSSRVLGHMLLLLGVFTLSSTHAQAPRDFAVDLSATVATNAPCITLNWTLRRPGNITAQKVHRRLKGETAWAKQADLSTNSTSYADHTAASGVEYEYWMERTYTGITPTTAMGYLSAGVNVPMAESRGKLLLVIDDTMVAPLAPEIEQLQADLTGDGWLVQAITAVRTNAAANVKAQIKAAYDADPANVKAVYLLGHVPVPYSGEMAPDSHTPDHLGAWPADGYYGEMNGTWTDSTVNNTVAASARNDNVPGDGKLDQSFFPSLVELMVGRVDLQSMTRAPSTAVSETALLRRYLRKAHDFRMKQGAYAAVPRRSIIRDSFGYFSGENFAMAGWSWAFTCVGQDPFAPIDEPLANQWFSGDYAGTMTYLVGYGNGAGSYESASSVGHTVDFGLKPSRVVFLSLFGSYFGDWDSDNNFLRAPLAGNADGDSLGLACFWGGRPNQFMHPLGMGETTGYGMRLSQNSSLSGGGSYVPDSNARTHTALMGDPALRLYPVEPPRNLTAISTNSLVRLAWAGSAEGDLLGYHVYRADNAAGPFTRLTATPLANTAFTDTSVSVGLGYSYLVRTLKRETVPGGTFDNLSVGSPAAVVVNASAASAPPAPGAPVATCYSSTNALLAWPDTSASETGFRIERKINAGGSFAWVGSAAANATNFTDRGVFTNGNVYYYRIVATNAAGSSSPSAPVSFDAVAGFFDLSVTRMKLDKAAGNATLTVNRLGGAAGEVSVNYATSDTSALAGAHYAATNGVLTWGDGDTSERTISVPIFNTAEPQAARQFTVTLSSPSGGASLTVNTSAAILIEDATATLDAPWSQTVLSGITDSSPAVTVSNVICSVTMGGAGVTASSTYEAGQFVYQNRSGDGVMTAYFPAGLPEDGGARYAIMARATTANNAVMAAAVSSSSTAYGTKLISRSTSGETASALPLSANALVVARWLRLTRSGNLFVAETSADGQAWTLLGSVTLASMPTVAAWGVFHYSTDWSATSLGSYHLAFAQDVSFSSLPTPSTPTGLVAAATAPGTVRLTWNSSTNASTYRVERCAESGSFTQVVEIVASASTTQTWADTSVAADTAYAYRVAACNSSGNSGYSAPAYVATPQPYDVALLTPDSANGADAHVRRDLPDTPLGTATNLMVAGYDPEAFGTVLTNAAKTYLRFEVASPGTVQRARLNLTYLAEERYDETGFFNLYVYVLAESSDAWAESALTWNNAPQNSLAGVGFTGSATILAYTNFYALPVAGDVLSFDLNTAALTNALGSNQLVTVALTEHTSGAIVHWASREHPTLAPPALELSTLSPNPARPSFLTATIDSGWAVTLRWRDNASDETGFELERRMTNGTFSLLQTLPSDTESFVDSTAAPSSAYEYRLRAVSAGGASSWVGTAIIVTPDIFHAVGTLWDAGGANTLVTTPDNWDNDMTPAFDGLSYFNFASGGGSATVNTNVSFFGMSLHRNGDFTIADGGATLSLGDGGLRAVTPTATSRTYTLAASVALASDQRWGVTNCDAGVTTLIVSGPVTDGASAFGITKSGNGVLTLAGSNSYDGATSVAAGGVLRVTHSSGLGSTNGTTTVALGAWCEIGGGAVVPEPLILAADGTGGAGVLRSTDGTNTWSGRVTQTAATRIRALTGTRLTLTGGVSGNYDLTLLPDAEAEIAVEGGLAISASRKVVANGTGTVSIASTGNSFGTLEVAGLTVRTDTPNTLPAATILSIGTAFSTSGTLDLNGNSQTVSQLKRGISTAGTRIVTSATPATLTVNGTASTVYDGQLAGMVGLTKTNSSTLTVSGTNNTYSGATTVMGGTLDISAIASLGNSAFVRITGGLLRLRNANAIPDSATVVVISPGKIRIDSGTESVGALFLGGVRCGEGTWGSTASAADFKNNTYFDVGGTGVISVPYTPNGTVWDAGGEADTQFDNPFNWNTDMTPVSDGTAVLFFGAGGSVATMNTNASLSGLCFNRDADFTLADGGGALTLGEGGLLAGAPSDTSRTYTLSAAVSLGTNQVWAVTNNGAAATAVIVSGSVSDGASDFGIFKTGNGTLTLAGSNSFDGVTSVTSGGVLRVTHACGLGSTNGLTSVELGGWLEVGGSVTVPEPLTLNGNDEAGSLQATDGTNAWSGRITQSAASRIRTLAGSRLALSGGVSGSTSVYLSPDGGSELAVTGPLNMGSSGKVCAHGAGTLAFGSDGHTFGTLEIAGLTVRLDAPDALPAGAILSIGASYSTSGTADLNGSDQTVSQLKRGISTAGARLVTSSTPATLTVNGSTSTLYDGTLAGLLSLVKKGTSTLTLSGTNNTFTGNTTVTGGTLDVDDNASLGQSQTVTVQPGGTLRLQGTNAIPDTATLRLAVGATMRVDADTETVGSLYMGGVRQRRGTYGATTSEAEYQNNSYFSTYGSGMINVLHGTESVFMVR